MQMKDKPVVIDEATFKPILLKRKGEDESSKNKTDYKRVRKSLMLSLETMERFLASKQKYPEYRDFSNDRYLLYLLELENQSRDELS
ncbi:hypothetical protein K7432_007978 [Basidiobolus ranarum]|uniref:Uncharacterized protein n=1 Tax=Basidiobolus ranarum TaxID=34480 RepID=A0ABR2VZA8_9FUNG